MCIRDRSKSVIQKLIHCKMCSYLDLPAFGQEVKRFSYINWSPRGVVVGRWLSSGTLWVLIHFRAIVDQEAARTASYQILSAGETGATPV